MSGDGMIEGEGDPISERASRDQRGESAACKGGSRQRQGWTRSRSCSARPLAAAANAARAHAAASPRAMLGSNHCLRPCYRRQRNAHIDRRRDQVAREASVVVREQEERLASLPVGVDTVRASRELRRSAAAVAASWIENALSNVFFTLLLRLASFCLHI